MENVKILVGFASEEREQTDGIGRSARTMPIIEQDGAETVFATMAVARDLLDDSDARAELARFIAEALAAKVQALIEQGPLAGAIL